MSQQESTFRINWRLVLGGSLILGVLFAFLLGKLSGDGGAVDQANAQAAPASLTKHDQVAQLSDFCGTLNTNYQQALQLTDDYKSESDKARQFHDGKLFDAAANNYLAAVKSLNDRTAALAIPQGIQNADATAALHDAQHQLLLMIEATRSNATILAEVMKAADLNQHPDMQELKSRVEVNTKMADVARLGFARGVLHAYRAYQVSTDQFDINTFRIKTDVLEQIQ